MTFEAYAERIVDLKEYAEEVKKPKQFIQRYFHVKNTNMQIVSIKKYQFAGLKDEGIIFQMEYVLYLTGIIY